MLLLRRVRRREQHARAGKESSSSRKLFPARQKQRQRGGGNRKEGGVPARPSSFAACLFAGVKPSRAKKRERFDTCSRAPARSRLSFSSSPLVLRGRTRGRSAGLRKRRAVSRLWEEKRGGSFSSSSSLVVAGKQKRAKKNRRRSLRSALARAPVSSLSTLLLSRAGPRGHPRVSEERVSSGQKRRRGARLRRDGWWSSSKEEGKTMSRGGREGGEQGQGVGRQRGKRDLGFLFPRRRRRQHSKPEEAPRILSTLPARR